MVLLEDTVASCEIVFIIFHYFSSLSLSLSLSSKSLFSQLRLHPSLCNLSLSLPTLFVSVFLSFLSLSRISMETRVYGEGMEIGFCGEGVDIKEPWWSRGCGQVIVILFLGHGGCCDNEFAGLCSQLGQWWLQWKQWVLVWQFMVKPRRSWVVVKVAFVVEVGGCRSWLWLGHGCFVLIMVVVFCSQVTVVAMV